MTELIALDVALGVAVLATTAATMLPRAQRAGHVLPGSGGVLMILVWLRLGSSDSGGAFQSGAVLAGALILLRSAGVPLDRLTGRWLRPLLIVGMIGFILTGALAVSLGNARLGWSPEWSFAAMLTVEIALTAGIVRVVGDVYGIHVASELGVLTPLLIVACLTILYGSYQALRQEDLKKRLAYSTVSHVSYVVVGISLVTLAGTTRGVVHLVHQGLMKIALFFCAGLFAEALGITKLSQMHGLGRRMPWTSAAFTVGAFAHDRSARDRRFRVRVDAGPGCPGVGTPLGRGRADRLVSAQRHVFPAGGLPHVVPRPRWRRTAAPRRPAAARPRSPVRPS
ncbi:proton-conducting transporter membrane subunit [Kocuria marina]|uniref:proton-conducting transporter transmembrane domain-containing protein n=1 Tax=Kocuria marina TaxID=223184 RepID=UPI0038168557